MMSLGKSSTNCVGLLYWLVKGESSCFIRRFPPWWAELMMHLDLLRCWSPLDSWFASQQFNYPTDCDWMRSRKGKRNRSKFTRKLFSCVVELKLFNLRIWNRRSVAKSFHKMTNIERGRGKKKLWKNILLNLLKGHEALSFLMKY